MPDEPEAVGSARADAAHRRPASGAGRHPTARWCACPTRTAQRGTANRSARATRWCERVCAATARARSRSRRRSLRSTPMPMTAAAHRLVADRGAVRPAAGHPADAGRGAQPGDRDRRAARAPTPAWPRSTRSTSRRSTTIQPFHAARADLLARAGRAAEARAAYDRAIELTTNATERAFLEARRSTT